MGNLLKVLLRKVRTASTFSFAQWKIIGEAYLLLLKARLLLHLSPLRLVEKALSGSPPQRRFEKSAPYSRNELLELFQIAWRYQWGRPNCLPKALAQQAFLSRYGVPVRFRIGVRRKEGRLEAHSWCEDPDQPRRGSSSLEDDFRVLNSSIAWADE